MSQEWVIKDAGPTGPIWLRGDHAGIQELCCSELSGALLAGKMPPTSLGAAWAFSQSELPAGETSADRQFWLCMQMQVWPRSLCKSHIAQLSHPGETILQRILKSIQVWRMKHTWVFFFKKWKSSCTFISAFSQVSSPQVSLKSKRLYPRFLTWVQTNHHLH